MAGAVSVGAEAPWFLPVVAALFVFMAVNNF